MGRVARIADGGQFVYPSTNSVYIAGHANRFDPNSPDWPFSQLDTVRVGDIIVVTTTNGVFTYQVYKTEVISFVDFPTPEIDAAIPKRLVAWACKISPDRSQYAGNFVVFATLVSAKQK